VSTVVRDLVKGGERPLALTLTRMQWSADSRFILAETVDAHVAIRRASENECASVTTGLRPKGSQNGHHIYFLRADQRPGWFELRSADRNGSDEKEIDELGPFRPTEVHFDVSRQGAVVWAPNHIARHELWEADP